MTTLALKEKILDFYYNLYLCLVFLRSCVVALLPLPKKKYREGSIFPINREDEPIKKNQMKYYYN